MEGFQQKALEVHNQLRAHHQVGPLIHNPEISVVAQKWAQHMADQGSLSHSRPDQRMYKGSQMGENIAMKYDSRIKEFTGGSATKQWYSEIKDYDFATGRGRGTVGHFTQVVWKDSCEFGIGRAQDSKGVWYVCANYFPAGNFIGKNMENVMAPKTGMAFELNEEDPVDESASQGAEWSMGAPIKQTNNGHTNGHSSYGATNGGGAPAGVRKVSTSTKTETKVVNGQKVVTKTTTETTENPDGSVETRVRTETF